jgi:DNA-binding GntR family transcriptional regulator
MLCIQESKHVGTHGCRARSWKGGPDSLEAIFEPLIEPSVTLVDRVADTIKAAIINARLLPGERLYEQELSKSLGVSRTPLREAIQHLIAAGWVARLPGGGVSVSRLSRSEVVQVYQVRAVLEGLIAREAAVHLTDEQMAHVGELTQAMSEAAERGEEATVKVGRSIHKYLRECTPNKIAAGILDQLHERIDHYRHLTVLAPGRHKAAAEGHRELFEALRSRDPDMAEAAMRRDILRASEKLTEYSGIPDGD